MHDVEPRDCNYSRDGNGVEDINEDQRCKCTKKN